MSACAGNPLLIDLAERIQIVPDTIDYARLGAWKLPYLRTLFDETGLGDGFDAFSESQRDWLDDYAHYRALKTLHVGSPWREWPIEVASREPAALAQSRKQLADEIAFHAWTQHQFFTQWMELKRYANERDIRIIGEIPRAVPDDSADAWAGLGWPERVRHVVPIFDLLRIVPADGVADVEGIDSSPMRVLQTAFIKSDGEEALPHHYPSHVTAYTGRPETDTAEGWFAHASEEERDAFLAYSGRPDVEVHEEMIRLAMESPADTVIIPLQDVLGLGPEARLTVPGRPDLDWSWRFTPEMLTREESQELGEITDRTGRA